MGSKALSWAQLGSLAKRVAALDTTDVRVNGLTNSHTRTRLFGQDESKARVTLFRDNHAWCPYCQKIWLFLEEKKATPKTSSAAALSLPYWRFFQVPYKIEKVTMFCYGEKESWYKRRVPSGAYRPRVVPGQRLHDTYPRLTLILTPTLTRVLGMLPAIEIDGQIVTESDDILFVLEECYGPLNRSMSDRSVVPLRQLERELFGAWCRWLCYPSDKNTEARNKKNFVATVKKVELALSRSVRTGGNSLFVP